MAKAAKPAARRAAAKPAAKRPAAKPATKRPAAKPAAKRPAAKPAMKAVAKPVAARPASKPAAKPATPRPTATAAKGGTAAARRRTLASRAMPAAPLGPSRIVWVFRIDGLTPMAIGKLYVVRAEGSPQHLLMPRRRLAPGRYELMFARYGVRWPVTLTSVEGGAHADDMLVLGRVPL